MKTEKQRLQVPLGSRLVGAAFGVLLFIWWGAFIILSPLILCYALSLLSVIWFGWYGKGKDFLFVRSGKSRFTDPLEEIQMAIETRSEFLDWDERNKWPKWSAGPRLFRLYTFFYGPMPFALERSLPIALFFPRFKKPLSYVLGGALVKREENLAGLKEVLALLRK